MARAFSLALSGRPGPVVLALPEDVLAETTEVEDALPVEIARPAPSDRDLQHLRELLASSERPLVVVGEGGWTQRTGEDVLAFCEANELPVACAFRCQDFVDNRSSSYVGVLGVAMDEQIFLAREVRKVHTEAAGSFATPEFGPLGVVDAGHGLSHGDRIALANVDA